MSMLGLWLVFVRNKKQKLCLKVTSADVVYVFPSRLPWGVIVKLLTPLTVLSSCVVLTNTSTMNLKAEKAYTSKLNVCPKHLGPHVKNGAYA